jgi:D-sedoheptulose 7-phosphate isomerase
VTRPAVFFDRDGVLNEVHVEDGRPLSPRSPDELRIESDAPAAAARLRGAGLLLFAVTNQPDIARGHLDPSDLDAMMSSIAHAVRLDDYQVCPHDDGDGCGCRKPRPGMLTTLARQWDVDLGRSFLIGDTVRDVDAGRSAGCTTILVRRPYNVETSADIVVDTLAEAADAILERLVPAPAGVHERSPNGRRTHTARYLREAAEILARIDEVAIEAMADGLAALRADGGRLFFLGVGGSASNASHATNDFRKIAGFEAYAATDNVAELTARTNDDGWASTFVEYLRGCRLTAHDAVFALSVGGGDAERNVSTNLVEAIRHARQVGARVFAIVGRDGGFAAAHADHCVIVPTVNPASITPHTESFQAIVWHLLVSHPLLQRSAMKWESLNRARL